jgi:hypothetical protein
MTPAEQLALKVKDITHILDRYRALYPLYVKEFIDPSRYEYVHLFGVRFSAADTSLPDDYIGGFRINKLGFYEIAVGKGSVDPSPLNILNLFDQEAISKGGAAFMMEGQTTYRYIGRTKWKPHPAFCPVNPANVYRFNPTAQQKTDYRNKGVSLTSTLNLTTAKRSTSRDTCIHRAWGTTKLTNDGAGCQIVTERDQLDKLGDWAVIHIGKKYTDNFVYTLFSLDQFIPPPPKTTNPQKNTTNSLFTNTTLNIFQKSDYISKYIGKGVPQLLSSEFIDSWYNAIFQNKVFGAKNVRFTHKGLFYDIKTGNQIK